MGYGAQPEKVASAGELARDGERLLAARVAGAMALITGVTAGLILTLPGVPTEHWRVVAALAALGVIWGVTCLMAIPARTAHWAVAHLFTCTGLPVTAVAMAATGGASSPARYSLYFIVAYSSYFYAPRTAYPYIVACIAVLAAPLFYDSGAVDAGFIGEVVVASTTYLVLGALIMAGKRLLVELSDEANDMARSDALTGLANRRAFVETLDEFTSASAHIGNEHGFGLVLVDLDDFKDANTLGGHPGGDRVLKAMAAALVASTREEDLVARVGGDEFAIVARSVGPAEMETLTRKVMDAIEEADADVDLSGFDLSASMGWALYPEDASGADELVSVADIALHGAKSTGKNRVVSRLESLATTTG